MKQPAEMLEVFKQPPDLAQMVAAVSSSAGVQYLLTVFADW